MAEPDSDPRNTVEDEDLEDGEIETDEEVDDVNEAKAAKPAAGEPAKKAGKMSEDESKKASDAKSKTEHRKSTPENNATKSKKAAQNDAVAKGNRIISVHLLANFGSSPINEKSEFFYAIISGSCQMNQSLNPCLCVWFYLQTIGWVM